MGATMSAIEWNEALLRDLLPVLVIAGSLVLFSLGALVGLAVTK